ncbi:uncharacterized protein LOC101456693 [Ceratitis capitata]|uniref:uncharacterized protein LOC101456693 n=1 Tax=Ceratitis capitata TaxID=7213 RepID=UPI000329EEEF|nr:uncharacterized protein LOC101456693 [Ceratitis capitata]
MAEELRNRLRNYRIKRQREQILQNFKTKLRGFWMLGTGKSECNEDSVVNIIDDEFNTVKQPIPINENTDTKEEFVSNTNYEDDFDVEHEKNSDKLFKYILWILFTFFWVTLYIIFIKLQFGMVYLICSALVGLYLNTRTGPKKLNEVSAYSVFNKNCESISGTLKAEQFEKEIRFGAVSVK